MDKPIIITATALDGGFLWFQRDFNGVSMEYAWEQMFRQFDPFFNRS